MKIASGRSRPIIAEKSLEERIEGVGWDQLHADLDNVGWGGVSALLTRREASNLAALYGEDGAFRSTINMARHGFGRGEYRYFRYPLPPLVDELRVRLYEHLLPIANRWRSVAGLEPLPRLHREYIELCHDAGQTRPTPLIFKYGEGDYNCLHQDLYGDLSFPLQAVFLLSEEDDFDGGELILTEQRPRMQSRVHLVPLRSLGGAVFAVARRPVSGTRGTYHVAMRHGISTIARGSRQTLGIIFHDAR